MKKVLLTLFISLLSIFSFAGEIIEIERYDNGNIKHELIAASGVDGDIYEYNAYYADGSIDVKGKYNEFGNKHGVWTTFYKSGQIESSYFYNNGLKHGKWVLYDVGGSVLTKIEYKNGNKHGIWERYSLSGKLICHREFKIGNKCGIWKLYSNNGEKLLSKEEYKRDKLIKHWHLSEDKSLIARY